MIKDFGSPIVDRNMPRISGHLRLLHEIKHQLMSTVSNLKEVKHPIIEGKEAAEIIEKSEALIKSVLEMEDDTFNTWAVATECNTLKVNNV